MPNVVGERFQITIDKKVREELGIQPGDQAMEWVEDGRLVVAFMPRPHSESMLGILKRYRDKPIEPITDWEAYFDRAWAARGAEIREVLEADSKRHRAKTRSGAD
jgi:AbrB family looped-hinge helix DNA binding protein